VSYFVDLLEFRLRALLVLRHVGMMHPRQFAESLANFIVAGGLRNAERLVIVFVLHGRNLAPKTSAVEQSEGTPLGRDYPKIAPALPSDSAVPTITLSWTTSKKPGV
jgi:hypothetical protein